MYIGRFAPSPTGPLHMGSLVAALGSFLRARSLSGLWLLRIEDLDPPREVPGAADEIRRCLHAHGLFEDRDVLYQSSRLAAYESALESLASQNLAYRCTCSRKQIAAKARPGPYGLIYPGTCAQQRPLSEHAGGAWRVRTSDIPIAFSDLRCGDESVNLRENLGDFIVKRADGFFAYQLAVVVDDAFQGVTEVVRGEDLLDNSTRQIYLQQILDLPQPDYLHLPLICNEAGQKLSKQNLAQPVDPRDASANITEALAHLGLKIPIALEKAPATEQLNWAVASFSPALLPPCKRDYFGQDGGKG